MREPSAALPLHISTGRASLPFKRRPVQILRARLEHHHTFACTFKLIKAPLDSDIQDPFPGLRCLFRVLSVQSCCCVQSLQHREECAETHAARHHQRQKELVRCPNSQAAVLCNTLPVFIPVLSQFAADILPLPDV